MKFVTLIFTLIFPLIFSSTAFSWTTKTYFINRMMVNVSSQHPDGTIDDDAAHLFELMNVRTQDSFMGPGKAIITDNRDFNMTCGTRQGQGPMCSFIFNASSRASILPSTVSYKMSADDANRMSHLWKLNNSALEWVSDDGKLKIHVTES
jgi:hypothetical protein